MNEDTLYRTTTQYKSWSFTPTQLTTHRHQTNTHATHQILSALPTHPPTTDPLTPLTPSEESTLLNYHISLLPSLSTPLSLPSTVRITASQYLRRFYLFHSPQLYSPKTMTFAALFLATKIENFVVGVRGFCEGVPQGKRKVGEEAVREAEGVLVRGLRFQFLVEGGGRGLEGGGMELFAVAEGKGPGLEGEEARRARERMEELPPPPERGGEDQVDAKTRVRVAHARAKGLLTGAAQMTDVYFLYTPAQIWMGALFLADEPLTMFYVSLKGLDGKYPKLVPTLRKVADLLRETENTPLDVEEARRVGRKLYFLEKAVEASHAPSTTVAGRKKGAEEGGSTSEEGRERGGKKPKLEVEVEEGAKRSLEKDGEVFGGGPPRR